jgi:hypothetical protein
VWTGYEEELLLTDSFLNVDLFLPMRSPVPPGAYEDSFCSWFEYDRRRGIEANEIVEEIMLEVVVDEVVVVALIEEGEKMYCCSLEMVVEMSCISDWNLEVIQESKRAKVELA